MRRTAPAARGPRPSRGGGLLLAALALAALASATAANERPGSGPTATPPSPDPAGAESLLVLEFELNDLTLYPKVEQERARVASLRPLLLDALAASSSLALLEPPATAAEEAARGQGYLFDRPAVAARLGRLSGADWVLTGRLHKASHLFVYLKAQLVEVGRERVAADFVVELKGWGEKLTRRGVETLGAQLLASLGTLAERRGPDAGGDAATGAASRR